MARLDWLKNVLSVSGTNVGRAERVFSLIAGGALSADGIRKGSAPGIAEAVAGGYLLFRGATGRCAVYKALDVNRAAGRRGIVIDESVTIERPASEVYSYWRDVTNFPRFIEHIESVRPIDARRSHWVARVPGGHRLEWDSEITHERKGEFIAWRTLPGSELPSEGLVIFSPVEDGTSTELKLSIVYNPPQPGAFAAARLLKAIAYAGVKKELRSFKEILEGMAPEKAAS